MIHPLAGKMHRPVMSQAVNRPQFPMKEYILSNIGSSDSKIGWSSIDQDIVKEKQSGFPIERGFMKEQIRFTVQNSRFRRKRK